jgi:hypothetical protein
MPLHKKICQNLVIVSWWRIFWHEKGALWRLLARITNFIERIKMHPSAHGPVARKIVCVRCVPRETIYMSSFLVSSDARGAWRSHRRGFEAPRALSRSSSSIRHKGNLWRRAHKKTRRIINSNLFVGAGIWVIINARAQQGGQNGADTLLAKIQLLICHSGPAPSGRYLQRKRDSLQHLLQAAFYTNTLRLIKIVASQR